MKIGITYDLRDDYLKEGYSKDETAEFDRINTIDAIDNALKSLGHQTERIGNIRALVKCLAKGASWDLVFNICEGLYGLYSRESQVPALLDAYQIPCTFSDPLVTAITLKKSIAKILVKAAGLLTPDFYVLHTEKELNTIDLPFPLFVKPIAEGTSKGVNSKSRIKNQQELTTVCRDLLNTYRQPVLIETFCSGREFTVGMIGTGETTHYLGALEIILKTGAEANAYSYNNKENCEEWVDYQLVNDKKLNTELETFSKRIWRLMECRDAGRIDFMLDQQNRLNFIEINPLAGLNPEHSDLPILCTKLGISFQELIRRIVASAAVRAKQWP